MAQPDPFADLDATANAPPPTVQAAGADPFSDLDPPQVSTAADVAKSTGQGLLTGAEGLVGLPGDISRGVRWAANKVTSPIDYGMALAEGWARQKAGALPAGETPSSFATKEVARVNDTLGAMEPLPSSTEVQRVGQFAGLPNYQPQTTAGKYAETVGSFLPGAAALPVDGPAALAANAVRYGVVPGLSSEAAGQITQGSSLEPYARAAAGLVGGVGSDLAVAGGAKGIQAAKGFAEPFSASGQQAKAARDFSGTFEDPQAALATLQNAAGSPAFPGAALGENIPGSKPSTGQITGDRGALSFERGLATADPVSSKSNDFGTGSEQQNAARTAALQNIQQTGDPSAVGDTIRANLAKLNADHNDALQSATQNAQRAASGIGTGATPEDLGASMRTALQGPADVSKTQERALWGAVDPDGTLAMPAGPIADAANGVVKNIPATAKPMSGEEAAIFDTAANLPPVAPFGDVTALRSRISSAMREEMRSAGPTPTYARLGQLRGSVEDAIVNAATHKAASDGAAVAAGEMAPQDALQSRIDGYLNEGSGSQESGQGAGRSAASSGAAPSAAPAGTLGASGQGSGRFGNNAGDQGISGSLAPNLAENPLLGPGRIYHPGGSLDVNYELANLPDLVTSHTPGFSINKAYPAELQPRARQSAPARDQVNTMASQLQPERLGRSPEANSGAPIVGPDDVVESGNGRTLALSKAYQAGRGGDYKNWLASQGVDTAGLDRPVLIARRQTEMSPQERVAFTHAANTASGLAMTDGEKAFSDAKLMSGNAVKELADSGIDSAENRPFVRSFLSQLSPSERADLMDGEGNLSQKGVRRLDAALVAKGYGDANFIDKAFVTKDANVRGLAGALTDAAPAWIKMREFAREGVIDPEHDVTPSLMNAVRGVVRARLAGRPVAEVLNQGDMFGGEASSLAKGLLVNKAGQLAGREQIAANLRNYANEAQKNLAGPGLFGDTVAPSQVLKASLAKSGASAEEPVMASAAMKPAPVANLDAAAASRLKAASAATRDQRATFQSGPVGQFLKRDGSSTDYKMSDASGPGQFWKPGPKGAETAEAFRAAAGHNGPPNMNLLHDAAAESLSRAAITPDGVLDPKEFAKWRVRYRDALRALPADLKDKFSNAAEAAEAVGEAAAARKTAIDNYQKSVAGKFIGVASPEDVTKTVEQIFGKPTAGRDMSNLRRAVEANPEAKQGLRKAVADVILSKAIGTTENGASGVNNLNASTFQKFLRDNAATIQAAGFSQRELGSMQAIGIDMQRGQRTLQATKLAGQSNSPQDLVKAIEAAHKHPGGISLMTKIMGGAALGFEHSESFSGAALGAAGAAAEHLGEHLISAKRAAGLANSATMVRDAMLSPELAMALLAKAPVVKGRGSEYTLAKMLERNAMFAAQQPGRQPQSSSQ